MLTPSVTVEIIIDGLVTILRLGKRADRHKGDRLRWFSIDVVRQVIPVSTTWEVRTGGRSGYDKSRSTSFTSREYNQKRNAIKFKTWRKENVMVAFSFLSQSIQSVCLKIKWLVQCPATGGIARRQSVVFSVEMTLFGWGKQKEKERKKNKRGGATWGWTTTIPYRSVHQLKKEEYLLTNPLGEWLRAHAEVMKIRWKTRVPHGHRSPSWRIFSFPLFHLG